MPSTILTVSIPPELDEFLNKNPDLSPSKLLQRSLTEIKDTRELYNKEILRKDKHIVFLQSIILKYSKELERLGVDVLKL